VIGDHGAVLELQSPNWPAAAGFLLLGLILVAALKRHLRGKAVWRYDTRAAWLRAFAYFAFCWSLGMASGTVATILGNPLVLPGQSDSLLWWSFTLLVCGVVFVGYWIIWPIGTLPHGRRVIVPDTVLFGIAWGVSEGLLMASVWVLSKRGWESVLGAGTWADFAIVATTILVLSAFIGLWHALYWDVHIAPEHNIIEWNMKKVLWAHNPNVILSSIYVTAWENVGIFVLLQAVALFVSSLAMPFPSPRWPHPKDPTGPDLGPPTDEPADLDGRTVVVTGAAHGMGFEAAQRLARMGARLVLLDRDEAGLEAARDAISGRTGVIVDTVVVDLADLDDVRRAAHAVAVLSPTIDLLLNNAGMFTSTYGQTRSGIERTLAVNHLGPFLLTQLLLPFLRDPGGRIVFVSTDAHYQAVVDWDDLNGAAGWKGRAVDANAGFAQYNVSKLFVVAGALELADRLTGTGIAVNSFTPGALVPTGMFGDLRGPAALFMEVMKPILRKPSKAMITYLYVCTSPEVDGVTGWYFKDGRPLRPSQVAQDPAFRAKVWAWSQEQAGLVGSSARVSTLGP
jgi:NAD(P)-dependent dehydrogenase (short-subunit alcohol dehydrogenase family)